MSIGDHSSQAEALWNQASSLVGQGQLLDAIPLYLELSDLWPERAIVWLNLGIVLGILHRHDEARQCLQQALELEPDNPLVHYQLGQMQEHLGQLDEAARSFLQATELDPSYLDAWNSLADICLQCGETDLARQYLEQILLADKEHATANFSFGNLLQGQGDDAGAARHFTIAYKSTGDPACGNNLASAQERLGQIPEAIDVLQELLQAHPNYKLAWNTLGGLLLQGKDYSKAHDALMQALKIDDDFHAARHGLARCLVLMRDLLGARDQFRHLLQKTPQDISVLKDLAVVLERLGENHQALALREQAIELTPNDSRLLADHANLLQSSGRNDEAVLFAQRALALNALETRAHIAIATVRIDQKQFVQATQHLAAVISSNSEEIIILNMVGALFERLREAAKALAVYEHILTIDPDDAVAAVRIFDLKMSMCDWRDYDEICQAQIDQFESLHDDARGEAGGDGGAEGGCVDVFNLQALPVSYDYIGKVARHAAKRIAADARENIDARPLVHTAHGSGRIRLGYALGYTWFHSLPLVMKEVIERHDRDRFEVFGYSVKPSDGTEFNRHYRAAFDHFSDIPETAPYLAAQMINADGIDVLIDVTGLTSINCMPVSSFRPAPVQMHGYGYSITTGADYIDYLITDRTYIPPEWEAVGPEKLLYLPNTFMPTKRPDGIGAAITRTEANLPEDAIVFCNFNHPCKFEPTIFAAWMEILSKVPGSVLWFGAWTHDTQKNLQREASKHGIDNTRLIFAEIVEHKDHLARLDLVDLALDNLHHGGGITTVDALWVGLPVLTILGDKPGARLGATLCNAAGTPDMVVPDLRSYIKRAMELAKSPDQRQELRRRLLDARDSQPLFNNERYCRNLDNAIEAAWNNHLAGEAPRRIEVGE